MRPCLKFTCAVFALSPIMLGDGAAHDFWLESADFTVKPGETTRIEFLVGHGSAVTHWNLTEQSAAAFKLYGPEGDEYKTPALTMGREGEVFLPLESAGIFLAVFQSNPSYIELSADKFNAYLEEEGLTSVARHREAHNLKDAPGRERYSRRAKTILRAGDAQNDDVSTKLTGQTLEIRPEKSPFLLGEKEKLPVRIYFQGEPLAGASVSLENLRLGVLPEAVMITDAEGGAEFALPKKGAWKLNVVWSTPINGDARADYETTFSSFTFSYD